MNYLLKTKLIIFNFILCLLIISCVSKTTRVNKEEINIGEVNHTDINTLLQSSYLPSEKDFQLILHNSNTGLYYTKHDNCNFTATKLVIQDYQDSLLTIKSPSKLIITYKNGLEVKWNYVVPGSYTTVLDHIRNADGVLLKDISTTNGVETNIVEYRYDIDRIYAIYIENNNPKFYTTYFLNEKKQCYRKIIQSPNHEIDSDYQYFYDDKGRYIKMSLGTVEVIYTYLNDSVYTSKNYDLETKKLSSSMETTKNGKQYTMLSKDKNKNIDLTTIIITEPNCNSKTYAYNSKNELVNISVSTVEE